MLKTTASLESLTLEEFCDGEGIDGVDSGDVEIVKKSRKSKGQKMSKSQKLAKSQKLSKSGKNSSKSGNLPNFGTTETGPSFLTLKAKLAFNRLWLAFIKAPILWHFDPKYHIWIETDVLGYIIGGVLSQLVSKTSSNGVVTKTNLGQWHSIAFFSRKMILAETWYENNDGELLAIVETFKTWRHYLKGCKHEILVFTDHNNLRCFIDTKSLSSRQIRWVQKLFYYHFQIDYCQGKASAAADALLRFSQKSRDKKDEFWDENGQIFHCLQNLLTNASLAGLSLSSLFFFLSHLD